MLHDTEKGKERIILWYKKRERVLVRKFTKRSKINIDRSNVEVIKRLIPNVKKIEKRVEKLPNNDMRKYFELG